MDERIVQGAEVVKTHTEEFGTFQSPNWGPLGIVDKGQVLFYRESRRKPTLAPEAPVTPVDLVKIVAGAGLAAGGGEPATPARTGVVLEALGRGNVPPAVLPGVRRWREAGQAGGGDLALAFAAGCSTPTPTPVGGTSCGRWG